MLPIGLELKGAGSKNARGGDPTHDATVTDGSGGKAHKHLLWSWQFAASTDFSPFANIHQNAVVAHRFCLSIDGGLKP